MKVTIRKEEAMNFWVVKCRESKADGSDGWNWAYYLEDHIEADEWGGEDWIKSNESKKYIREEVKKGDLVVCYQTDGRKIVGFTKMKKDGQEEIKGSGDYNLLSFVSPLRAFPLKDPLTIQTLRQTGCDPKCFGNGRQGTIFPLNEKEFRGIVTAVETENPGLRGKLSVWLKKCGFFPK